MTTARNLDPAKLADGLKAGQRAALARAITLVESRKREHRRLAQHLIQELLPLTGKALRVGITGVPGVGKSTTIDTLGSNLTAAGHKVAVADMVDFFLVLMLPGAGDELQGIKKGVLELADMIAVNKADGDGATRARTAASDYRAALHILAPKSPTWTPPVITVSGLANEGLDHLWEQITVFRERMQASGEWHQKRSGQQVAWMWDMLQQRMMEALTSNTRTADRLKSLEEEVRGGKTAVSLAVDELATLMGLGE